MAPPDQESRTMANRKQALVLGATGVTGRSILRHLDCLPEWDVVAVSRRTPDSEGRYTHLALDLLDADACRARLGQLREVTHVFFAAYLERPSWAEMIEPNLAMLRNVLDAVEPAAARLRVADELHREARLPLEGSGEFRKGLILLGIVGLVPPYHEVGGLSVQRQHERGGEDDGPGLHGAAP
jgi:hypothetical protein